MEIGDEGKPNCQNCLTKTLECRYAAAFQILGKHNFTPEIPLSVAFDKVQVKFAACADLQAATHELKC